MLVVVILLQISCSPKLFPGLQVILFECLDGNLFVSPFSSNIVIKQEGYFKILSLVFWFKLLTVLLKVLNIRDLQCLKLDRKQMENWQKKFFLPFGKSCENVRVLPIFIFKKRFVADYSNI
jgi:hypothetical protein